MHMQPKNILLFLSLFVTTLLDAMLFDNRFFFILRQPITRYECQSYFLMPKIFIMTADKAFDDIRQETMIPALNGGYDQVVLANSLVQAGITENNLLPPDLRTRSSILWNIDAKIEAQGLALRGSYHFLDNYEVGGGIYFIHARQGYEFMLENPMDFTDSERRQLFESNKAIKEALGLVPAQWNDAGVGDAYIYGRYGDVWEYEYKFRRIDAGVSLGIIAPLAPVRDICNPASLPLGGNGHFGVFGEIDAQFELKEDWVAGFQLTVLKRLEKTYVDRVLFLNPQAPQCSEPLNYGILKLPTKVNPGLTVHFAPYFALERIRDGLGIRFIYHIIHHDRDEFMVDQPANLWRMRRLSFWGAGILSTNLLYDFGYYKEEPDGAPVLSLSWDVPVSWIGTKRVSRTNVISLTLQVGF